MMMMFFMVYSIVMILMWKGTHTIRMLTMVYAVVKQIIKANGILACLFNPIYQFFKHFIMHDEGASIQHTQYLVQWQLALIVGAVVELFLYSVLGYPSGIFSNNY